jgi:hypothetical protein
MSFATQQLLTTKDTRVHHRVHISPRFQDYLRGAMANLCTVVIAPILFEHDSQSHPGGSVPKSQGYNDSLWVTVPH